jgi:hypothetical protein
MKMPRDPTGEAGGWPSNSAHVAQEDKQPCQMDENENTKKESMTVSEQAEKLLRPFDSEKAQGLRAHLAKQQTDAPVAQANQQPDAPQLPDQQPGAPQDHPVPDQAEEKDDSSPVWLCLTPSSRPTVPGTPTEIFSLPGNDVNDGAPTSGMEEGCVLARR